mgnify:CR=1 FL=1
MTDLTSKRTETALIVMGTVIGLVHLYFNTIGILPGLWQNAIHFAGFALIASFGIGNMVQANSVVDGLGYLFPPVRDNAWLVGGGLALLVGAVWLQNLVGPVEFVEGGVLSQLPTELHGQLILIFLLLGWLGTGWASVFFFSNFVSTPEDAWWTLLSGGIIPVANLALGLKVGAELAGLLARLAGIGVRQQGTEQP